MSRVSILPGDNRQSLRRLIDQGVRVHSVVTDPPYGLTSVTKRFGKEGSAPALHGTDGAFARASAGFMNKTWDGTGIERDPEFWRLIWEILLPGGFVFAFSGSRTGHWQACAMETAGFIMHPMHGWVYHSGMPKAHDAAKAIDQKLGVKGEVVPTGAPVKRMIPGADLVATGSWIKDNGREYQPGKYLPASAEARQWDGWKYGTQSQKPAIEPIYLGQKPFSEKTGAENLMKWGVGAVNVDDCRVGTTGATKRGSQAPYELTEDGKEDRSVNWARTGHEIVELNLGRFPANLILDGSDEVLALFPDSKGQLAKASSRTDVRKTQSVYGSMAHSSGGQEPRNDSGSSARFYHQFPHTPEELDPIICHPKAGKADRDGSKHPTVKPIALMQYLIRHITPPGGVVLDPFAGSGTTGVAAQREGFDCLLMEAEPDYINFLNERFDPLLSIL